MAYIAGIGTFDPSKTTYKAPGYSTTPTTTKTPSTTQPIANPAPSPTVTTQASQYGNGWLGGTQPLAQPGTGGTQPTADNNIKVWAGGSPDFDEAAGGQLLNPSGPSQPSWGAAPRDPNRQYGIAPDWQSYSYGSWGGMVNDPRQQQRLADGKNYAVWGTSPLGQALRQSIRLSKQMGQNPGEPQGQPFQSGGFSLLDMLQGLVPQQSAAPQNVPAQPGSTQTNFTNLQDALMQQRQGNVWDQWGKR